MLLINPYRFAAPFDPVAAQQAADDYIAAVEAADGQSLEAGVVTALEDFIIGLHQDGIWSAIKASCILAGARTLDGALVPLVGTAPTNNNFVSGDYDRETGLKGNGSTKYLDSNRAENADPQNDAHVAANLTYHAGTVNRFILGASSTVAPTGVTFISDIYSFRLRGANIAVTSNNTATFLGASRSSGTSVTYRAFGSSNSASNSSITTSDKNYFIFGRNHNGSLINPTAHRLSFYSLGTSIDLAALDTRVSTLMTDLAAAIP